MRTHHLLSGNAAPLVALLVLLQLSALGYAKNLYPSCGGDEMKTQAAAGRENTLYQSFMTGRVFTLSCFVHEVSSVKGSQKDAAADYCSIAHQTEYPYRLFIRASYVDESGATQSRYFDIRNLVGGSTDAVTVHMDYISKFSLIFENTAADDRCHMSVRALMSSDIQEGSSSNRSAAAPTLVTASPSTIYASSGNAASFVLLHPQEPDGHSRPAYALYLVPLKESCTSSTNRLHTDTATALPSDFTPAYDASFYTVHTRTFSAAGSYRMCYRQEDATEPVEIAVITTYADNPRYYQFTDGQDEDGQVNINVPVAIKFTGYSLDTRPGADSAKLVRDDTDCQEGKPAGGVPVCTDLGPSDNYGPNTTYSVWALTIKVPGFYKLCYLRADAKVWTEVPYITEVNPGSAAVSTQAPTSIPTPTDPNSKTNCPMAPDATVEQPWIKYKSIQMVMTAALDIETILQTITTLFCVPRSAVAITRLTQNSARQQIVYFSFQCADVLNDRGNSACDSTERGNYAVSLSARKSSLLGQYGIHNVSGSTSMVAAGDDITIIVEKESRNVLVELAICVVIVTVVLAAAHVAVKYREKRQYMVQFGMDDGDMDDMYAIGAVPPAPMSGRGEEDRYNLAPPQRFSSSAAPRDAVIEMED